MQIFMDTQQLWLFIDLTPILQETLKELWKTRLLFYLLIGFIKDFSMANIVEIPAYVYSNVLYRNTCDMDQSNMLVKPRFHSW